MHCPPRDDINDNNDKTKLLRNWHDIYRVKGKVNNKNVYILRLNEKYFATQIKSSSFVNLITSHRSYNFAELKF